MASNKDSSKQSYGNSHQLCGIFCHLSFIHHLLLNLIQNVLKTTHFY